MLAFVPLGRAELARWAGRGDPPGGAWYAVTPALREAFGFAPADDEEAERTAAHIAGLAALLRHGHRLVAVVEVPAGGEGDGDFGEVPPATVGWSAVTALFAGEPGEAGLLPALPDGLAQAWEQPAVTDFLAEHPMLWHGPGEWGNLV